MNESILKKDFKEDDLKRIRNLINKKYNDKTRTQTGYQKEIIDRMEGEIWEENGKKWTVKNGLKLNISKLDGIREKFHLPLLCPNCNNIMNSKLDKKFYNIHNQCFNCVIDMEQRLRLENKWEEYEQKHIKESSQILLSELEKEIEDFMKGNETFVTEHGDVETWSEENKEKIIKEIKEYINNVKSKINI